MQLNILNALIDNSIKEIFKERSLDLDDMENPHSLGEKAEEKLIKISAKQKSKSIFTDFQQRKPTFSSRLNYNQRPFYQALYQEFNKEKVQAKSSSSLR